MLNHAGEIVYEDLKCFTDGESIEKYISDGTTIKNFIIKNCFEGAPSEQL